MPSIWDLNQRSGSAMYWDGSNPTVKDVVLSSAVGAGTPPEWLDRDVRKWDNTGHDTSSLRRINSYLGVLKRPLYPFVVDQTVADEGHAIFDRVCAACHAQGGSRVGTVIPIAELGTDRQRLDVWTAAAASGFKRYGEGHDWGLTGFRKTDGYVAQPLDGVWLRAPYLHNGSVPSLSDLLEPAARRPRRFRRGYDVYDPVNLGFVSSGAEAERLGTIYDTSRPGNGNAGHSYGTELPAESKRALIEFLKTQ
jgi:hypothetical protein